MERRSDELKSGQKNNFGNIVPLNNMRERWARSLRFRIVHVQVNYTHASTESFDV